MKLNATCLVILLFFASFVYAQQPAFPTAEGAGMFTTGGRGTPAIATTIYEVTDLTDNATTPAVGSFRYAVTNNSPAALYRTVIFRVSGTIRLAGPLSLNRANTTIAGQTAPGDGICIADYPVSVSANNLIIRYLRFRLGDRYQQARLGNDDALSGTGRKNIIIDHCSMSWSNDETLTIYGGDSTTLQWNILSEPLDHSYHDEGTGIQNHAYGGIWGGRRSSMHHNLIAHVRGRAPRFDGCRNLSPNTPGLENVDFRNNVIYNWADYNVNGGEGGNYNVVNNYYKYGPSTPGTNSSGVNRRSMIINPFKQTVAPVLPYGKYYLTGNYSDNSVAVTANNWLGAAMSGGSLNDTTVSKVIDPFTIASLNTQSATDAYNAVLNGAGAILPSRDTLDQRIANDVRNRTGRLIDVQGGYPAGTPFTTSQTAWPTLNSLPAPLDTDHDGMPDSWEILNGSNISNAADRNNYAANGYTLLENYLNSITSVLPLQLLSFTAIHATSEITTSWTTANEVNTKKFVVERSRDGSNFSAIGIVAAINTTQNNRYHFSDIQPLEGIAFYRLQMVDIDGEFTYSPIVKVNRAKKLLVQIITNPVADKLVVSHTPAGSAASIKVLTADGKTIRVARVSNASVQTIIMASDFKAGVYYLVYESEGEKSTIRFLKK